MTQNRGARQVKVRKTKVILKMIILFAHLRVLKKDFSLYYKIFLDKIICLSFIIYAFHFHLVKTAAFEGSACTALTKLKSVTAPRNCCDSLK